MPDNYMYIIPDKTSDICLGKHPQSLYLGLLSFIAGIDVMLATYSLTLAAS